jgi:hypothetical protein
VPYNRYTATAEQLTLYASSFKLASIYAIQPHK